MFTFHQTFKIKLQQEFNPYYQYAKPDQMTVDKGWTVYFIGSEGNDYIYGDDFSDTMYGNGGRDGLVGGGGKDFLYGGEDDDTFIGGEGADEMYGEEGDDFFFGELDGNIIDGGDGFDTVSYFGYDHGVTVLLNFGGAYETDATWNFENITNVEEVIGTSHDDIIAGDDFASGNRLLGGAGNDVLSGNAGTDTIIGGAGGDELWGGTESDIFEFRIGDSIGSHATFDTVKDFDLDDDVMRFQVYDAEATTWFAQEGIVEGIAGTWVRVSEAQFTQTSFGYKTLYEVFLEGTAIETVGNDDIEFF